MKLPDLEQYHCQRINIQLTCKIDESFKTKLDDTLPIDNPFGERNLRALSIEEADKDLFLTVKYFPKRTKIQMTFTYSSNNDQSENDEVYQESRKRLERFWRLIRQHVVEVTEAISTGDFFFEELPDPLSVPLPMPVPEHENTFIIGHEYAIQNEDGSVSNIQIKIGSWAEAGHSLNVNVSTSKIFPASRAVVRSCLDTMTKHIQLILGEVISGG